MSRVQPEYIVMTNLKTTDTFYGHEQLNDMINAIKIKQSTIARIFKFYSLEIINVGVNDENSEAAFLVLYAKKAQFDELLNRVLPEFTSSTDENIKLQPKSVWKVKAVGMAFWTIVLAVVIVCIKLLDMLLTVMGIG